MRKKMIPAGLMVLVIVSQMVSCAYHPDVVGRWQQVDGGDTLEFREDGTFAAVDNKGGTVAGQYTLHADGTLYYATTHTAVMPAVLKPVKDLEVNIAGVKVCHLKAELALSRGDSDEVEVYRRAGRF